VLHAGVGDRRLRANGWELESVAPPPFVLEVEVLEVVERSRHECFQARKSGAFGGKSCAVSCTLSTNCIAALEARRPEGGFVVDGESVVVTWSFRPAHGDTVRDRRP
jgi:hypothetical protein